MKTLSFLLFFFLFTIVTHQEAQINPDLNSLLSFKNSNPKNSFFKSWSGPNPCVGSWTGIKCDKHRVIGIYLHNASLEGSLTPLFEISQLRVLSLKRNNLSCSLPQLNRFTNPKLRHLILSHNQINGVLNLSLPSLLSLRLEHNNLSGGLEALNLPILRNFNVSNNNLLGEISQHLSKFPKSSFDQNPALCGSPLSKCLNTSELLSNTTAINESQASTLITSNSSTKGISKLGLISLLAIGIGNLLLIVLSFAIIISIYIWVRKRLSVLIETPKPHHLTNQDETNKEEKEKRNGLVCFEGAEDLKLDLLLKSSAEVLGKGITGSTYKAVLEDGIVVAVKRLSVVQFNLKNDKLGFDKYMGLMGRLRHENVVSLRGYFSSDDQKLLVYDFMPNGCLQSLLQSNARECSPNKTLDWSTRKQILFGAGHGLHYIHTYPVRPPLVHGNIKPSNILINEDGTGCISECGLMKFGTSFDQYQSQRNPYCPSELRLGGMSNNWSGYKAPELLRNKGGKGTQESDVYSFGMVLLELVTDKSLDEADCEEEGMKMVKIGMICTAECPDDRPHMGQVLGMLSEFM